MAPPGLVWLYADQTANRAAPQWCGAAEAISIRGSQATLGGAHRRTLYHREESVMRSQRLPLLLFAVLLCSLLTACSPRTSSSSDSTQPAAVGAHGGAPESSADAPAATADSAGAADLVHATRTGKRYHRADCSSLSQSDLPMSRSDAEARGLTPCHNCKP